MKKAKIIISTLLASLLILSQVSAAFARSTLKDVYFIRGTLIAVTLEIDPNSGIHTVLVTVRDEQDVERTFRISEETAYYDLHLLDYDDDGNPFIVTWLPGILEIDPTTAIPDEEVFHHPVATALATFFSDVDGVDYDTIMEAHASGFGFGVIAQALWMVKMLDGTSDDFMLLLHAKQEGNFANFPLADGTVSETWGQLRKGISENLGTVLSQKNKGNTDQDPKANGSKSSDNNQNKDNSDHGNSGNNIGGNGHSNKP